MAIEPINRGEYTYNLDLEVLQKRVGRTFKSFIDLCNGMITITVNEGEHKSNTPRKLIRMTSERIKKAEIDGAIKKEHWNEDEIRLTIKIRREIEDILNEYAIIDTVGKRMYKIKFYLDAEKRKKQVEDANFNRRLKNIQNGNA